MKTLSHEVHALIDIAVLMYQELHEIVDEACDDSDDPTVLADTQALLVQWEQAYNACGFQESDHFRQEKAAADPDQHDMALQGA